MKMSICCEEVFEDPLAMLLKEALDALADGRMLNHSDCDDRWSEDLFGMGDEVVVDNV